MPELVAHEIQPAFPPGSQRHQADHLVQRHAAVNNKALLVHGHLPVHLRIHQAERQGLVPHQGLVMALAVSHVRLAVTPVGQRMPHVAHAPFLVLLLLEQLDPVIGNAHGQPMGKAQAPFIHRAAQPRHAGHVLRNRDGARSYPLDQRGGQLQISHGVQVHGRPEVRAQIPERLVAPVEIQHGRHAVKAEPVKAELLQPPADIGQQELNHLVPPIVKAAGIPVRMMAALPGQEIHASGTVKIIQTFRLILHGMGMHHIQQHGDVQAVRLVNQVLQILRRAETGGRSEKGGNVIAEGAIIGMLLDGHQLDGIVAQFGNAGENFIRKLPVRMHALLFPAHAHMRLVNERHLYPGRVKAVVPPFIGVLRHPYLPGKIISGGVLHGPGDPRGNTVLPRAVRADHVHLHLLPVGQRVRRQRYLPHAALIPHQRVALPVPAVEIPRQEQSAGGGRPFPVRPCPRLRITVEAVIAVPLRIPLQRAGTLADPFHFQVKQTLAVAYLAGIRLEPAVRHHQTGNRGSSHYPMILRPNQQGQGERRSSGPPRACPAPAASGTPSFRRIRHGGTPEPRSSSHAPLVTFRQTPGIPHVQHPEQHFLGNPVQVKMHRRRIRKDTPVSILPV